MIQRILLILLFTTAAAAQERLMLTVPMPSAGAAFRIWHLDFQRQHADKEMGMSTISITFREADSSTGAFVADGKTLQCSFAGKEADTILVAINKANFTSNSLEKHLIEYCQAAKKIGAGTVVGVPQ